MKIITVIGARPQFIKAALFSEEFRIKNEEILVHTGQHYDENMSAVFFDELKIPRPDYNLNVGSCSHGKQTARMLESIEEIIQMEKPEGLLVYGDTNSTLAGALAASKLYIPVYHVEAGLRSYNKQMPEEINRILTDHLSTLLFCPTKTAVANLRKEGITKGVINTGDIMYDTVLRNLSISNQKYDKGKWLEEIGRDNEDFINLTVKDYYLATIHRAENTDHPEKLTNIFKAFSKLNKKVLLPLHPRTRKMIENLDIDLENTLIINPVGYLLMLYLTSNAYMVLTDSGGLQKEAYFLMTPCTTLRDQTEWVETLEDDWNVTSSIILEEMMTKAQRELTCLQHPQPHSFGEGKAALKICEAIISGGQINE